MKRPFELVVSFLRATQADLHVGDELFGPAEEMGEHLFACPSPAGPPDVAAPWLGSTTLLGRWSMPVYLLSEPKAAGFRLGHSTPEDANSWRQVCQFWVNRILGRNLNDASLEKIVKSLGGDENPNAP